MSRIPLLPKWVLPSGASYYDLESATISEMVPKLYGTMRELVNNYNEFADELNEEIRTFTGSSNEEISNFKKSIEERLRCKFNDFDAYLHKSRMEMKQYTDNTLERSISAFGVTVKETGEDILITDATNEAIRGVVIYGKTTQSREPAPDYPAALQSVGDSGSVEMKILNGEDEQLLTIATPEGLPGIRVSEGGNYTDSTGQKWVCDEIDLKRGVHIKRTSRISVTSTDNGKVIGNTIRFSLKLPIPSEGIKKALCSHLPYENSYGDDKPHFYTDGGFAWILLPISCGTTAAEVTEWLAKNPVDILYQLAEPVERPLTAAELAEYKKLHTYMPDTTVTTDANAGIQIEYVTITNLYMENKMQELTSKLINHPGLMGEPDAVEFEGYTANIKEPGYYGVSKKSWTDLPGGDKYNTFVLAVIPYLKNYNLHVAISLTAPYTATRVVNKTDNSVFSDWKGEDTSLMTQNYGLVDASNYSGKIANIINDGFYGIGSSGWDDKPFTSAGALHVFSFNTNYVVQIAYSVNTGETANRIVSKTDNSVFRDWVSVDAQLIPRYYGLVDASNYSGKIANITNPGFYGIGSSGWDDKPFTSASALFVFSFNANYVVQIAYSLNTGAASNRIVSKTDNSVFRDWVSEADGSVKILCIGDSIARGYRNGGKGFVGDLGFPYNNAAVSGATLSNKNTQYMNIPDQLTGVTEYAPDVIIANGGINDYNASAPLGDIPNTIVKSDEEAAALNRDTVLGALQYLFYKMVSLYPSAQRFFLLIHKVTRETGVDCTTEKNSAGYNQTEMFEAFRKVCDLYNVKIIDVFSDSMINTAFSQYRSAVPYEDDNTVGNTEFVDYDGLHPLDYGYKHGYVPIVRKALQIGTSK